MKNWIFNIWFDMHDVDILVKDIINDIKTNEKDINEYRNKTTKDYWEMSWFRYKMMKYLNMNMNNNNNNNSLSMG